MMHGSRPTSPLALAKQQCRAAYMAARQADPARGALLDRLYAETVMVMTNGSPVAERTERWRQSRILFQIFSNRTGWHAR
jgi:hypothetical protein